MFTGIIESLATVLAIENTGTNRTYTLSSTLTPELKPDQSLCHEGVCLTVETVDKQANTYTVTAIQETLSKTNLGKWAPGQEVNLERCMPANGRFDGHIVQGHVDSTAVCTARTELNGSWEFEFQFPSRFEALIIEKGSVCINGTSLTAYGVHGNRFKVSIIPYTFDHTTIRNVEVSAEVNIEFDILGKYLQKFNAVAGRTT